MTDKLDVEAIEEPREAAEYFCWVAGKDEQIEPLAAAFEARDNYWRATLAAKDEEIKGLREKLRDPNAHHAWCDEQIAILEGRSEDAKSRAAAAEKVSEQHCADAVAAQKENADLRLKLKSWTGALDIKRMEELLNTEKDNALNASIIANLRAALSGRTVSCSNCNVAEKERDELRADLKDSERKRRNQFTNMGEVLEAMKSAGFDPGDPTGWGKAAKAMASALNALQAQIAQAKAEAFEEAAALSTVWSADPCGDSAHDERYCQTCELREDGAELFGQILSAKAAALRQSVPASPAKEKP